ncbi:MAG: hypothetical protein ABIN89_20415 [Chitinophagaceae bacterium]
MKKKFLALIVAAMILFNSSFANGKDNEVNSTVLTSFSQQFEKATDVNWTKTEIYFKVTFTWNGQNLSAFYDANGESIAVSRNILPTDLPLILQTNLADTYSGYWVSDLFENSIKDNSKYYITIENADKKIILESMDRNYWSMFKKSTKE